MLVNGFEPIAKQSIKLGMERHAPALEWFFKSFTARLERMACAKFGLTAFDGEATLYLQQGRRENDGRARQVAPHGKRA
jgi:hypothetical protein